MHVDGTSFSFRFRHPTRPTRKPQFISFSFLLKHPRITRKLGWGNFLVNISCMLVAGREELDIVLTVIESSLFLVRSQGAFFLLMALLRKTDRQLPGWSACSALPQENRLERKFIVCRSIPPYKTIITLNRN